MIFNRMKNTNKKLLSMDDIPGVLNPGKIDVLVTIGAGNIDTLVEPIEMKLREGSGRW